MNSEEIIEMAMEAEFVSHGKPSEEESELFVCVDKDIVRFAELVAAKEREALAQTQEPVAWMYQEYRDDDQFGWRDEILFTPPPNDPIYFRNITPVYTHPPQRTWVGLEGEEIRNLWEEATKPDRSTMTMVTSFAKSIEAKLKQKNGYAEENA